jgi:ABC-type multidrug transport system fused ATPase/permease subunit
MIDQGIGQQNIQLINILVIAQLMIILSQLINSVIRSWMYMHIGIRASLRTVSNYLVKLLRLPISFFSTRRVGDILQRIDDNKRIERFITGVLTETLFGFENSIRKVIHFHFNHRFHLHKTLDSIRFIQVCFIKFQTTYIILSKRKKLSL